MPGRRVGLYFAWSRPEENGATPDILENRYPALYEFRRATYPHFEGLKNPAKFRQDITGFLQHIILSDFADFQKVVKEVTGVPVKLIERMGDAPPVQQLDRDYLDRFDTLIVVSLDHFLTKQEATKEEIEAMREFLSREDRCLFVCPHHDIGATGKDEDEKAEFAHHLDRTIPAQQRIGGFARTLLAGLGVPVENRWGLNPAELPDGTPAPLRLTRDLDDVGLLEGVSTFNVHPHLPHLQFSPALAGQADVLARQSINPKAAPHRFVEEGNREFNALLRLRSPEWPGRVYVGDATLWSAAFKGLPSLTRLWRNVAGMRLA